MKLKDKFINKNEETKIWNVRLTESERKIIDEKALLYTDGNASAWVRYAAINLKPLKKDIEK